MTEHVAEAPPSQQPEGLAARVIWLVAAGVVAISAVLITIAWYLVVPPLATERPMAAPSTLEHGLFDTTGTGGALRAAGEQRLTHYEWVDHGHRVVRIPIDQSIEAVIANPHLIDARSPAMVGAGATHAPSAIPIGDGAAGGSQ